MFNTYIVHRHYGQLRACDKCGFLMGASIEGQEYEWRKHLIHTIKDSNVVMDRIMNQNGKPKPPKLIVKQRQTIKR